MKENAVIHDPTTSGLELEYPYFDYLRFSLASTVVIGHVGFSPWDKTGNLAVQIFFALSGWLIGTILLSTDTRSLPRFFYNRATRIWTPYFAAVAILFGVSSLRDPINAAWLKFLIYDVTFVHNWFALRPSPEIALPQMPLQGTGNHFWSISVEEQFYLAAPLIMVFVSSGRSPYLWGFVAFIMFGVTPDFASISLGVFAASLNQRYEDWHLSKISIYLFLVAAAVTLSIMLKAPHYYFVAAPIFSISIVLIAARPGVRAPVGRLLGGFSFPIYLNHWIGIFVVHGIAKRTGIPQPTEAILSAVAGIIVGAALYFMIDEKVLRSRNRFYSPRLGLFLAICAYMLLATGIVTGLLLSH